MNEKLREKIKEALKEDFVGDVVFDDNELSLIYEEASKILRSIKNEWGSSISFIDYELIFIALINITKEWDSNADAFFDYVFRRLLGTEDGNGKVYTQICDVINKLASNNEIFMLSSFQKKYYATLISHAFAPISSINFFFNMCWEIYSNDLDFCYAKGDKVFSLIATSLNKRFSVDSFNEDNFAVGSNVYSFRAGLKGLALDNVDLLATLTERTIKDIDCLFNNGVVSCDKYYEVLLLAWWKKKEEKFGKERHKVSLINRNRVISDYSQIKAKYVLDGTNLCIMIPAFILQDNIEYSPYVTLKINGKEVLSEELYVKGSGILVSTEKRIINLKDYYLEADFNLKNVELEISHAGKEIYNSKKSLNREFVLFKDSREIYSGDCVPGQYFVFVTKLSSLIKCPQDIHKADQFFYSFEAQENESLQSDNKIVFFAKGKKQRDIFVHGQYLQNVKYVENAEEYRVVDGEVYVDLFDEINERDYGVNYAGAKFKLSEFPYVAEDNYKRYTITHLLPVGKIGKISIFSYSTNVVLQTLNIIKFNNIKINYDQSLYYDDINEGTVEFVTEKYHATATFSVNDEEVSIKFGDGELQVNPPRFGWKLDNEKFNYAINKKLWWRELNNFTVIEIALPRNRDVELFLTCQNNFIERVGGENKFKLGQTVHSIAYTHPDLAETILVAKLDNNEMVEIAHIYFQEKFIDSPIDVDEDSKIVHLHGQSFVGEVNKKFTLKVINNENVVKSLSVGNDIVKIDLGDLEDGYYKLQIVSDEIKGFLKKERILHESKIALGNRKNIRFLGKTLCIKKVMIFNQSEPQLIRPLYIDNIKYLTTTDDGFDLYCGSLCLRDKYGHQIYLNNMKDEDGNTVRTNPVRLEIMNNVSFYMGYGLYKDGSNFEYDNEFCISYDKKITVAKTSNRNSPDFYFYEEVK